MESSHLVKFSISGKFITKFNVLRCISFSEKLVWTGARGQIPITLNHKVSKHPQHAQLTRIRVYPGSGAPIDGKREGGPCQVLVDWNHPPHILQS